jgi:dihydroorotase
LNVIRLLKGGRVVDPATGLDEILDVLIEDGKITRVGSGETPDGAEVTELDGLVVCPGFLDMHVHLREPGQEWKETIASGTRSAAAGGFTAVACMPNTTPVIDSRAVTEMILGEARNSGVVRVYVIGCVTQGQQGKYLAEIEDMQRAGAVAFSDDGMPVESSQMMRKALEYSRIFDLPIIDHCEDCALVDGGVIHEGEVSTRLGLKGWPGVAEDQMVQRDIQLAEYTGGHVHIAHLSTGRSADLVRDGKRRGVKVTCEVTPHHLTLTDQAVGDYDTNAKMNPPLRAESDRDALLKAIADGTVDAIATDHAPHHVDEKTVEFSIAPFGIVGLETAISICLDQLVRPGIIDLARMIELFTTGPSDVLRIKANRLAKGAVADITILDQDRQYTCQPDTFVSKSGNTPFGGMKFSGAPVMTIVGGEIVYDNR